MEFNHNMIRVNKILNNLSYKKYLLKLRTLEKSRKFCCHGISHFLDVARIAYIINLELKLNINIELIYSAALLHDIGKAVKDVKSIGHSKLSAMLAEPILFDCNFSNWEVKYILYAILNHNNEKSKHSNYALSGLLYRADKLSRPCYMCDVEKLCYWRLENKNLNLKI